MQDLHSVDLEEFKYGGTNITAFRLVDPEKPELQRVVRDWIYGEQRYGRKLDVGQNTNKVGKEMLEESQSTSPNEQSKRSSA